jgi:serine protease Do
MDAPLIILIYDYRRNFWSDTMYDNNNYRGYQNPTASPNMFPYSYPAAPPPKRKTGAGGTFLLIIVCVIFACAAGFLGGRLASGNIPPSDAIATSPIFSQIDPAPPIGNAAPEGSTVPAIGGGESASDILLSSGSTGGAGQDMTIPEVAAIVRQTVVEIKTETVSSGVWSGTYISEGAGSGVIISEDGYIITNDHVIAGASSIYVRLVDGREFPASLIATDQRADIAVIKISVTGLTPAVFGDSSTLVIGEGTLAVGNPLGELGGTVTSGIISALDREMIIDSEMMTLLQTDAAVNPGNSGGGLFNMRAELIGIVNAKSSGVSIEGLGFAIPSNIARAAANDLINYGFVRGRTDVGLELVDIQTAQSARWYRVSQTGLYIISSADDQLRNGDRITSVNGKPVTDLYDYNEAMKGCSVGDKVKITVARGNESVSAEITLREWTP